VEKLINIVFIKQKLANTFPWKLPGKALVHQPLWYTNMKLKKTLLCGCWLDFNTEKFNGSGTLLWHMSSWTIRKLWWMAKNSQARKPRSVISHHVILADTTDLHLYQANLC
jgi:hypothetical protein